MYITEMYIGNIYTKEINILVKKKVLPYQLKQSIFIITRSRDHIYNYYQSQ